MKIEVYQWQMTILDLEDTNIPDLLRDGWEPVNVYMFGDQQKLFLRRPVAVLKRQSIRN